MAALYKIKHNLQRDARTFACWLCVWSRFILCLFTARCYWTSPPPTTTTTTTTTTHKNVVKINTQGSLRMYLCWVYVPCIYTHARWELLWMYLWCSLCTLYLHACQVRVTVNVPLMEFMYLVFTRMPGESYCRRLRSLLLCLCDVFRTLINSLICWFCTSALGLVLFQIYMLVSYSNLPTG